MFNFFKNLFKGFSILSQVSSDIVLAKTELENHKTGALEDNRLELEKQKDYQAEEIATFSPVEWKEKPQTEWRKFPIRNQDGSSSCIAQAVAKILGIENWLEEGKFIEFSARDIYTRRSNNSEGMYFYEALQIACDFGATLETLMPSQNKNEQAMNINDRAKSDKEIAKIFRGGGYVQLPFDIDKIASILDSGKAVLAGFRFNYDEWGSVPVILTNDPKLHHGVAIVDYTLYNGKKALIMDDSWGSVGFNGQRVITEEFLKKRITFAGYLVDLSNDWRSEDERFKPRYQFTEVLNFGEKKVDVSKLQECLKFEGMFPVDVPCTGYYGNITAKGVLAFQKKYGVASDTELNELKGRQVGKKTVDRLNDRFYN